MKAVLTLAVLVSALVMVAGGFAAAVYWPAWACLLYGVWVSWGFWSCLEAAHEIWKS